MKKQVKILAASEAEHQRWKAEAKRRGQTVTILIRHAVNRVVDAALADPWAKENENEPKGDR